VRENLTHIARSIIALFHYLDNPLALQNLVEFDPSIDALIARSQEKHHGVVVTGVHLSNFDLSCRQLPGAACAGLR